MVTLRKVSLTLADHHIGITHAGDGCSRRIADFDRAAAIELGEEFEAEQDALKEAQTAKEGMTNLPNAEAMPKVPEPMERPLSLGGLADRAGVEVSEEMEGESNDSNESTISSLKERTEEWNEDIAEKEAAIPPEEEEGADIDSAAVIEQELEREE